MGTARRDASELAEAVRPGWELLGRGTCSAAESSAQISSMLHLPASRDGRLQVALCLLQGRDLTLVSE